MADNKVYLILLVAVTFGGWANAYPNRGAYVVTLTGDDEAASYQEQGLLGRNMCTRGPAYWCHNITQAAECNAVKHCIKKVWEKPKEQLPEDNDSVCEVCLDMVKQARDQLLSNETQDELRQVLEGSCNLIPLKLVAKECCDLADDFIPELIDALTSRMDPQMVCHVSGLCNSVRIDEMLAEMKEIDGPKKVKALDPDNLDTCPMCEHYIGNTVDYLKGLTKDGLRIRLLEICGFLGSYSDSCKMQVNQDLDKIYDYLRNNADPKELCTLLALCPASSSLHRVQLLGSGQQVESTNVRVWQPPQGNDDDLECDFCKQLAESLRQFLVANQTKDEFKQVIEGLCKQTGKFKNECLNLAYQYAESLYVLLNNDFNPEQVCQRIGVCKSSLQHIQLARDNAPIWTMLPIEDNSRKFETSSSSEEDDDDSLVMMELLPAERLAGDDEIKPKSSKAECQFCEYALHYVQQYLDDAETEAEIKQKVDRLCDTYLPKEFAQQCETFVQEYGDALVTLLAQEVDPSQICPKLKLCPPPKPNAVTAVGHPVKNILPTCALCTFTVEKLIELVGKNMTKERIDDAVEQVCRYMPKNIQDDCLSFMKNYGDQVAEMILITGTAHGACTAIGLCLFSPPPQKIVIESQLPLDRYVPQTVTLDRVNQMNNVNDSPGCVICEFVITTLDQRLQDNATEEEIKDEVEHACKYLPKTVQGRCAKLIDLYGEQIIQYLSQEVDPAEICSQIRLCMAQEKKNNAIRDLDMDRCELCMLVSDYLSTMIEDGEVDKKIDEYAEKTCALIPRSYRQECNALIEDYGAYLLNVLTEETDKGKACAQVQLCPTVSTVSPVTAIIENNSLDEFEY